MSSMAVTTTSGTSQRSTAPSPLSSVKFATSGVVMLPDAIELGSGAGAVHVPPEVVDDDLVHPDGAEELGAGQRQLLAAVRGDLDLVIGAGLRD